MAHVRKDTLTAPPQYWDHLKEYKRVVAKAERKAAKKQIGEEMDNPELFCNHQINTIESDRDCMANLKEHRMLACPYGNAVEAEKDCSKFQPFKQR